MTLRTLKVLLLLGGTMVFSGMFSVHFANAVIKKVTSSPTSTPKSTSTPKTISSSDVLGQTAPSEAPSPTPESGTNVSFTPTPSPVVLAVATTNPAPTPSSSQTPVSTPTPSPIAVVSRLEFTGTDVWVTDPGATEEYLATSGQTISEGSTIETGSSQARLVYWNGGFTRLDANSKLIYESEPSPTVGGSVLLESGRIWNRIIKVAGLNFSSRTADSTATVYGTAYGQFLDRVLTVEGVVGLSCKGGSVSLVEKNYAGIVNCQASPQVQVVPFSNAEFVEQEADINWVISNIALDGDPQGIIKNNLAPTATIEADSITVTLPVGAPFVEVTLVGKAEDPDRLPFDVDPLTAWFKDGVWIPEGNNKSTIKVNLTKLGTYTFELLADDTHKFSISDPVVVNVVSP